METLGTFRYLPMLCSTHILNKGEAAGGDQGGQLWLGDNTCLPDHPLYPYFNVFSAHLSSHNITTPVVSQPKDSISD
jgi:hypothetical protein